MAVRDQASRLIALMDKVEPRLRRQYIQAITNMANTMTLGEIAQGIESGRIFTLFDDIVEQEIGTFATAVNTAVVVAGNEAVDFISNRFNANVSFDTVNTRAVEAMRANQLRLVREFTQGQREATRFALSEGVAEGANPRAQARNFRNSIGLTASQYKAVENYRSMLETGSPTALQRKLRDRRFDPSVNRAINNDTAIPKPQIDKMVERYQQRYLKYRSEVIARTESLSAVHTGTEEGYMQGADRGLYSIDEIKRKWVTAKDERVRHSHAGLNGLVRGVGETFPGDDGPLRRPGDPNAPASETVQCRCALSTRLG